MYSTVSAILKNSQTFAIHVVLPDNTGTLKFYQSTHQRAVCINTWPSDNLNFFRLVLMA